jgi:tetratricopeptide (TPR) repeat protein
MPRPDRVPHEPPPPGVGPRENEPETPEINLHDVPRNVRAELKSLPKELAATVGAHLVAAGQLIETDPEAAYAHAEAAKRRAARLPIAREALAETAYAAGHYDVALTEFRALRRMTGSPDYIAVLADCERALGRPDAALKLVREGEQSLKDPALLVELRIVQAGARADSGQQAEALRLLANEIESPRGLVPKPAQARLRYAYAALLLEQGDRDAAQDWFTAAARIDPEGTDALDRLDELNGFVLITDFDDDDDEDSDVVADDGEDTEEVADDDEDSDVVADDDGEDTEDESDDTQATFDEQDDELPSEEDDIAEVLQKIEENDAPDANPEGSAS